MIGYFMEVSGVPPEADSGVRMMNLMQLGTIRIGIMSSFSDT
jgi:hypothetical protein